MGKGSCKEHGRRRFVGLYTTSSGTSRLCLSVDGPRNDRSLFPRTGVTQAPPPTMQGLCLEFASKVLANCIGQSATFEPCGAETLLILFEPPLPDLPDVTGCRHRGVR